MPSLEKDASSTPNGIELPLLREDPAFWGMTGTQFLGAFNDNVFKQLMLLLSVPIAGSLAGDDDQQWLATVVFSLPFVLFSGYAGYLADLHSKKPVIVLSKIAEIGVMALGMAAFLLYDLWGYFGLLVVLFLMGAQSAFFGPSKYGILPEMLRETDLPRANGVIIMTTFLAIIFGTASAGAIKVLLKPDRQTTTAVQNEPSRIEVERPNAGRLWLGSACCVGIAIAGTATSFMLRRPPASRPRLQLNWGALVVSHEIVELVRRDRMLIFAILASSVFWMEGGIAMQAVNSLGLVQLELNALKTSILTAVIGLGIAVGALLAGRLCGDRPDFRLSRLGLWGMAGVLTVLSLSLPSGRHLLGFWGSLPMLALLGMSAGLFSIPVQVFLQSRPPKGQKGRMIALMNQANFIAILLSGFLYLGFDRFTQAMDWPRSAIFFMMMLVMLPLAILFPLRGNESPDEIRR